jgi:HEAT repeat protein
VRHDVGVDRTEALVASTSEDWSERAAAARVLAEALDDETKPALLRLLSDHDNTAVVQAAAESLLARRDSLGIDLFCVAYAQADDELGDHLNDSLLAVPQQPENLSLMREAAQRGMRGAIQALQWLRLGP